jgi:hypothetical protein
LGQISQLTSASALLGVISLQSANNQSKIIMKTIIIGLLAIFVAIIAQIAFIGVNGLTIISIPTTIYFGFEVIEKLTENKSNC